MKYVFALDGTITTEETLSVIAEKFKNDDLKDIACKTISGDMPFIESIVKRVSILGKIPETEINNTFSGIKLNNLLIDFIKKNSDDCIVVTANYSGWIEKLSKLIPCRIISSPGVVDENGILKLSKILKKEEVVDSIKATGESVVYVGDGNNDSEAMRNADISIACGILHSPARSVMSIADFLVIDTSALVRLLKQIQTKKNGISVVVSSAGIGSRLGFGKTKALIKIHDKTLMEYQLQCLNKVEDIRIVVGYQADEVIEHVRKIRNDVIFVFNHDYFHTMTGASFYLGSRFANEYVVAWDGDLIVHPNDVDKCLLEMEYIGCSEATSENTVFVDIDQNGSVFKFTRTHGDLEWTGPACLRRENIRYVSGHLFTMIENHLPLPANIIRAFDIDTNEDLERAKITISNWNLGNQCIDEYYSNLAMRIKDPIETRNKAKDFTDFDVDFVLAFSDKNKNVLDLGSGTGLLINRIYSKFKSVTAVEKYDGFAMHIIEDANVNVEISDLLNYKPIDEYDIVTIFGVMNFFNNIEALNVYKMAFGALKEGGRIIVKNQMGIEDDVIVNGFSAELQTNYYSQYRTVESESKLLNLAGFGTLEVYDIYPSEYNRWDNTHFYALVGTKPH